MRTTWILGAALAALMAAAPVRAQKPHADSLAAPVDTVVTARPDQSAVSPNPEVLAQVVALEDKRRKAMVAGDINTLQTIIAEDATYVHATGIMQTRDELLRLLANKTIQYLSFEVEKTSYRVYGNTVVGTGVQAIKVLSGGKSLAIKSRYTAVYTERDGVEKLIAYQSTPLPEMTPAKK
jgi:hypothetical protein